MRSRSSDSIFIYESSEKFNVSNNRHIYNVWSELEKRCYIEKYREKFPSYIGCSVDPRWHNFQNFATWFEKNYIESWKLDKDILVPGNKIYGPDTCCFVPHIINMQFRKIKVSKYGFGVSFNKECKLPYYIKTGVRQVGKKSIRKVQYFSSSEEASLKYIEYKEELVKSLAIEFKKDLKAKTYNALINYKIINYE